MKSSFFGRSVALAAVALVSLTACGSPEQPHDSSMPGGMSHGMHGMSDMPSGTGLTATQSGYRFVPRATTVSATVSPSNFAFQLVDSADKPVTRFEIDQTKKLHFYLVRSDLTGFAHLHPTMAPDGTWTATLPALRPGKWRAYVSATPSGAKPVLLSTPITVAGQAKDVPLPQPSQTADVDGYRLTVSGKPMSGMADEVTARIDERGKPVTDLQPYLDSYAHVSAFHAGTMAFAHLHPQGPVHGAHGGPNLRFHAEFPSPGQWRVFLQFQVAGRLHTAALTMLVG